MKRLALLLPLLALAAAPARAEDPEALAFVRKVEARSAAKSAKRKLWESVGNAFSGRGGVDSRRGVPVGLPTFSATARKAARP